MNYQIDIYPEHKLILERIEGEVTVEGLMAKTAELFKDPRYRNEYVGVVDMRQAVTRMTKVELYGFAEYLNQSEQFAGTRWAILGSNPMVVALSQIFRQRIRNMDTIGVFSEVESAARFLENHHVLDHLPE